MSKNNLEEQQYKRPIWLRLLNISVVAVAVAFSELFGYSIWQAFLVAGAFGLASTVAFMVFRYFQFQSFKRTATNRKSSSSSNNV